jgi:tRNA A22 N-methylase
VADREPLSEVCCQHSQLFLCVVDGNQNEMNENLNVAELQLLLNQIKSNSNIRKFTIRSTDRAVSTYISDGKAKGYTTQNEKFAISNTIL